MDFYFRVIYILDGIKRLIVELEVKGYVYFSGGDVYYLVCNFDGYGKFFGCRLEDL